MKTKIENYNNPIQRAIASHDFLKALNLNVDKLTVTEGLEITHELIKSFDNLDETIKTKLLK